MTTLLWLIPVPPLLGFAILALRGRRMPKRLVAAIGVGTVGLSAALALILAGWFLIAPPAGGALTVTFWTWFQVGGLSPAIAFRLDALSLVFTLVVTVVGFLIHLYSAEFMAADEGYGRFFAAMNLFVGSMLVLVLASNLLVLYLGWEGVGLCSYLLIGFWYKDPANVRAAEKAFIVTRVGDTALAVGLFLIYSRLGTLDIAEVARQAAAQWTSGSALAIAAAALVAAGAVGKSAQLPLQTWLPDAMAGPTPVSALIHAATMVTAGVYLIARLHVLFELAPQVRAAVAIVGAATLLIAGASALAQVDLKRILAYSTISQIGYMFLALGAGAWSAAVFHFFTHAFFKALLFLGAGAIIAALEDEHDITRMGGLRREMPLVFWTFLAGAASLAAVPFVTAGFYSKEWILAAASTSGGKGILLWIAGLAGAFLTVLYTSRMVIAVFTGPAAGPVRRRPGLRMKAPLVILAVLSIIAGFIETPRPLGHFELFSRFLSPVLAGRGPQPENIIDDAVLILISCIVVAAGLFLAWILFRKRPSPAPCDVEAEEKRRPSRGFFLAGWGFDWLYDRVFVRPLGWLARVNRNDIVDQPFQGLAGAANAGHAWLARTQSGRLRWYAAAVAIGAAVVILVAVFL